MSTHKKPLALVTGATSGIGLAGAKELAKRNYQLVLAVRSKERGKQAKAEIESETPEAEVSLLHCNLSSFQSITEATGEFKSQYDRLDVLINNAGIWKTNRELTEDGIELHFGVNHLAPFLMTLQLLLLMKESTPSRVVTTSSRAHESAVLKLDDLEGSERFRSYQAYGQSKLCNILFTRKLAEKFSGTGITANCFHPGVVKTNLFSDFPLAGLLEMIAGLFMISPEKGAETLVYLADSEEVDGVSGEYFVKKRVKRPNKAARDSENADRLWEISMDYVSNYLPKTDF